MAELDNNNFSLGSIGSFFSGIMGLSFLTSVTQKSIHWDSAKIFVLGALVEISRRLFQWVIDRIKIPYRITARFTEGDPSYDWIILFLTQEKVWRHSQDFRVCGKNSQRKWSIELSNIGRFEVDGNAEYIPSYKELQMFRWKGYWIEIGRSMDYSMTPDFTNNQHSTITLAIYTLDINVLYRLVEEAHSRYKEVSKPSVTVHQANEPDFRGNLIWASVKHKTRRPLSSVILDEGVVDSLAKDIKEFISAEKWYTDAGIPYRRGYLLYGPPGTGKTSTIYALAGELDLEIYVLSLSSKFVDDSFLHKAASSIPKHSILLIEDIDCAFPPRRGDDDADEATRSGIPSRESENWYPGITNGSVTLSGLLNVIDGIGSEEGKLFFATTNHIDQLDAALIRPGRIDMKIQYNLSTKSQAEGLFLRFFDHPYTTSKKILSLSPDLTSTPLPLVTTERIHALAQTFASHIPAHEFSTAELQGFLLSCKHDPVRASESVLEWVASELVEREAKRDKERKKIEKMRREREEREARGVVGAVQTFGKFIGAAANGGSGVVHASIGTDASEASGPATPSPAYEPPQQPTSNLLSGVGLVEGGAGNSNEPGTTAPSY